MKRVVCALLACLVMLGAATGLAHSGRTDSSGGHRDNKNASGLGSYHYHCGGNPPHLHAGGVCPYSGGGATAKPASTPKPTAKPTQKPAQTAATADPSIWDDEEVRYGLTNAKGVNVRAKATTDSRRLQSFPLKGTAVMILDEVIGDDDAIWYRIDLETGEGFVFGKYVDVVEWEAFAEVAGL